MTNKIKCSKGYGVITQSVMSSKDISIEAKALYCYYMAYVGDNFIPSATQTCIIWKRLLIKLTTNEEDNREW